jgi:ketosteroid isomerase-like protein
MASNDADRAAANKEVVLRYFAAMERRDWDAAADCWAQDAVNRASGRHDVNPAMVGRDALKRVFQALHMAFPDRHWQLDAMIAEGDRVACLMTVTGSFGKVPPRPPGPLPPNWLGVESTALVPASAEGKPYSVKHVHVFTIQDGLITEHQAARDDLALLLQLGAISPPA